MICARNVSVTARSKLSAVLAGAFLVCSGTYSSRCFTDVDMRWFETATSELGEGKKFSETMPAKFPGKLLAYNCSPSFNWKAKLDRLTIAKFQRELGAMGYKFQFVTRAGFHALTYSTFKLARGQRRRGRAPRTLSILQTAGPVGGG